MISKIRFDQFESNALIITVSGNSDYLPCSPDHEAYTALDEMEGTDVVLQGRTIPSYKSFIVIVVNSRLH